MAVAVYQPKQQTSMGRRLLAMAAPVVGGAFGGVGGAIAGGILGGKLAGGGSREALLQGVEAGASKAMAPKAKEVEGLDASKNLQKPELGSAFSRRQDAISQSPQVAINEGLSALSMLPKEDPLQQYAGPLVQAQMLSEKLSKPSVGSSYKPGRF